MTRCGALSAVVVIATICAPVAGTAGATPPRSLRIQACPLTQPNLPGTPPPIQARIRPAPGPIAVPPGVRVYGTTVPGSATTYAAAAPAGYACQPQFATADGAVSMRLQSPSTPGRGIEAIFEAGGVGLNGDLACRYVPAARTIDARLRGAAFARQLCTPPAAAVVRQLPTGTPTLAAAVVRLPARTTEPMLDPQGRSPDTTFALFVARIGEPIHAQLIECALPATQRDACGASLAFFLAQSSDGRLLGRPGLLASLRGLAAFMGVAQDSSPGLQPPIEWRRDAVGMPEGNPLALVSDDEAGQLVALVAAGSGGAVATYVRDPGGGWERRSDMPSGLDPTAIAYDGHRKGVLLVGSQGGASRTYLWDGSSWNQITSGVIMGAPRAASLGYDPLGGRMVLFGGSARPGQPGNVAFDSTYLLAKDGQWNEVQQFQPRPAARDYAALTSDPQDAEMLLFGGFVGGARATDTWLFDPDLVNGRPCPGPAPLPNAPSACATGRWRRAGPSTSPPAGSWWGLADPALGRSLVVGRSDSGSWEDWLWNGLQGEWTKLGESTPVPPANGGPLAAVDALQHTLWVAARGPDGFELWQGRLAQGLVGIGDSFTSGEGVPPFSRASGGRVDHCDRSAHAYVEVVAASLGIDSDNRACSGAGIASLTSAATITEWPDPLVTSTPPPQLGSPISARYVALTLGGNEAGFSDVLQGCIDWPFGKHCSETDDRVKALPQTISKLEGPLTAAYKDVAQAYPSAHVYVMGYPNIFSRPATSGLPSACQGISLADVNTLIADTTLLDQSIARAVAAAGDSRITYVDDGNALSGHELCQADQWVNPVDPWAGFGYANVAAFHPNEQGQAQLAKCLQNAIQGGGSCNGPPPGPSRCECMLAGSFSTPGGPPIALSIAGLAPGRPVTFSWHSARAVVLGRPAADARGRVRFLVRPPRTSALGRHLILVTGRRADGSAFRLRRPITLQRASAYVLRPQPSGGANGNGGGTPWARYLGFALIATGILSLAAHAVRRRRA